MTDNENRSSGKVSGQKLFSTHSIDEAEKRIRDILRGTPDLSLCSLTCAELDEMPENDEICKRLYDIADEHLTRIFAGRCIFARSGGSVIIFSPSSVITSLTKMRLGKLCDILSFVYEENGAPHKSSCAASMLLWNQSMYPHDFTGIKNAAQDALLRQRKRSLNGYTIMELDESGNSHESYSELNPAQLLNDAGIGMLFLRGTENLRCEHCNDAAAKMLHLIDDCCGKGVKAIFDVLREQDRVTLEALIAEAEASQQPTDITCRTEEGVWLTIKLLPLVAQHGACRSLLISVNEAAATEDAELEDALAFKKQRMLINTRFPADFEIDIATHTLTLSPQLRHIYDCKSSVVNNAPEDCVECCRCLRKSSLPAYCAMFEDIYAGKQEGIAEVAILSRLTGTFIPVKLIWKCVMNDASVPVKAVGVVQPLPIGKSDDDKKTVAEIQARLSLQEKYFRRSEEYLRTLRKYRHDRKNYIIAITGFLNEGRVQEALDFLAKISEDQKKNTPIVNTGNVAIDAIISEKLSSAIEMGIKVERLVGLRLGLRFDMLDLSLAVGSCLDNAVEASAKVTDAGKTPFIYFKLVEQRGAIVMKLENSYIPSADGSALRTTSKTNHLNHGFGLKNVKSVVDKYNGELIIEQHDNVFTTAFTLFM